MELGAWREPSRPGLTGHGCFVAADLAPSEDLGAAAALPPLPRPAPPPSTSPYVLDICNDIRDSYYVLENIGQRSMVRGVCG